MVERSPWLFATIEPDTQWMGIPPKNNSTQTGRVSIDRENQAFAGLIDGRSTTTTRRSQTFVWVGPVLTRAPSGSKK